MHSIPPEERFSPLSQSLMTQSEYRIFPFYTRRNIFSFLPSLSGWPAGGAEQRRGGAGTGRDGTGGGADKGAGGAGLAEGAGRRQQRRRQRGVSQAGGPQLPRHNQGAEGRRRHRWFLKLWTARRGPGAAGYWLRAWGPGMRGRTWAQVLAGVLGRGFTGSPSPGPGVGGAASQSSAA